MPPVSAVQKNQVSRVWEGECPVKSCRRRFHIEAAPWQPKVDVLYTFRTVRPQGRHVHGDYSVNEYYERGGE